MFSLYVILNLDNEIPWQTGLFPMTEKRHDQGAVLQSPVFPVSGKCLVRRGHPLLPVNDLYGHRRGLLVQKHMLRQSDQVGPASKGMQKLHRRACWEAFGLMEQKGS